MEEPKEPPRSEEVLELEERILMLEHKLGGSGQKVRDLTYNLEVQARQLDEYQKQLQHPHPILILLLGVLVVNGLVFSTQTLFHAYPWTLAMQIPVGLSEVLLAIGFLVWTLAASSWRDQ